MKKEKEEPLPEQPALPISGHSFVKKELKEELAADECTRKRPLHDANFATGAPAKRVKSEPSPLTAKPSSNVLQAPCPELKRKQESHPKTEQPVSTLNVAKSEPAYVIRPSPPQSSVPVGAPRTEEELQTTTAPTKQSDRDIVCASERIPRKTSISPLPCADRIQKQSSSEEGKITLETASLALNGSIRAHPHTPILRSVPAPARATGHSTTAVASTPVAASHQYRSNSSTCKPSAECEIEPVTPAANPRSTRTAATSSAQPAASSSVGRNVDDDETLKLCFTYGMVVVERDADTGEAQWIACKFCPVFGCRKRNSNYIMATKNPFQTEVLLKHLRSEHPIIWPKYDSASDTAKIGMFRGKKLPDLEIFQKRVFQLKSSYGIMTPKDYEILKEKRKARKREKKRIEMEKQDALKSTVGKEKIGEEEIREDASAMTNSRNDTEVSMKDDACMYNNMNASASEVERGACTKKEVEKEEEEHLLQAFVNCSSKWIERIAFQNGNMIIPGRRLIVYCDRDFKNALVEKLLEPFWVKKDKLLHLYLPREIEELISSGVLAESSHSMGKKGLFFHPGKYFLCEERTGKQKWDETPCSFAWKEYLFITVLTYFGRGFSIHTIEEMLEPILNMVAPEWVEEEESIKDMVWRIGNSMCAESMRMLRTVLKNGLNWLLIPTFVGCEAMGESGVEIFIPILFNWFELYFIHLISVRDGENVGDAVISVLQAVCEDWEEKLGGFYSHIPGEDKMRKDVERKITRRLGESAKMDGLRTFERGQQEVLEQTVEEMCEMGAEGVMRKISLFIEPYMASTTIKGEKAVCDTMLKELQGMQCGEIYDKAKLRKKHTSSWKKVNDRPNRELAKYMNGLQMIWRQESVLPTASIESLDGGFVHRHEAVAKCGIVKDWRCENIVDATLERTACGRNVSKLRCILFSSRVFFESRRAKSRHFTFQAAHMFDANWSNTKGMKKCQ